MLRMCPGVSISRKGPKPPRTSVFVVPASGETAEAYWPRSVLKRVDLPELASPRITTLCRNSPSTSSAATFQFIEARNLRTSATVEGRLMRLPTVKRSRARSVRFGTAPCLPRVARALSEPAIKVSSRPSS